VTSRNAPCPCGSGRRYKECHGALGAPASLEDVLRAALAAHQAARLDEAAVLYERALALAPDHFDALHMLGVVAFQQQRFDVAERLIGRAVALQPDVPDARRNLTLARNALERGRFEQRYAKWIDAVERPRIAARAAMRAAAARRDDAPFIAILTPTYETRDGLLRACLDSVLAQEWPHWELCVADDASPSPHVRRTLEAYAARDRRIRVTFRRTNGHIAEASNTALGLVTAPFVALLDHDDALPPHALAEIALDLLAHPQAAIVYTDEDKIDEAGRRFEPYFKPDWNPALLLAQNYVSHLGVYRTSLVREVGTFRRGFEGAQDWDLLLRCAERVPASAIRHVPQVLYHWRATATSTARSMEAKSYAADAQERVVRDACARRGVAVEVRRAAQPAFLDVDPVPVVQPSVSLVLLHGPGADVAAWQAAVGGRLADTTLVDAPAARIEGPTRTLAPGDARTINIAVAQAHGDVIVLADARHVPPAPASVGAWVGRASQPDQGPVGAVLVDARRDIAGGWTVVDPHDVGRAVCLGEPTGVWGMAGRLTLVQNVTAVRLDAMAVRRDLWLALGGLDETLACRWHDVDLCLRAAGAGRACMWDPRVVVGSGDVLQPAEPPHTDPDAERMRARWSAALAHDAAYHDDLTRGPRWFDLPADSEL
jgi:GT2 family glycosyltransferase